MNVMDLNPNVAMTSENEFGLYQWRKLRQIDLYKTKFGHCWLDTI